MKFTELKNSIKQGVEGVYLLEGDDGYFRGSGEEMIKSVCLQFPELDFSSFDGASLKGNSLTAFTAAIKSYPFGSQKRVVKVSEFYPTDTDYERFLKDAFENIPDTSVVIIVNSQSKKGVELKRKKCITYVDCNRADEETVTKWVYVTLRRAGVNCSAEAASAVAAYCLCDMSRVAIETQKLIALGKPAVLLSDVDELVYKDADYRVYEMTGAIPRKNYTAVCEIIDDLLCKGMDKTAVISSMLTYFRNLYSIICSNDSDADLALSLKMKEYGVKKSREQAKLIGKAALKSHILALYGCISGVKGGLITADSALDMALNEIFFKTA